MGKARILWSTDYKRKCFDVWYLHGRPNLPSQIREIIPENDQGNKPSALIIGQWLNSGAWDLLADELDVRVEERANQHLVTEKVKMLRKHQDQAVKVQNKALESILVDGFDSSSSAVQAFFRGMEEERKTAGFSDLLEKLESMSNNQVRDEIISMIQRATENNQIVEGKEIAGELEDNTVSTDEEE